MHCRVLLVSACLAAANLLGAPGVPCSVHAETIVDEWAKAKIPPPQLKR
jgi:hypothetical protein